MIRLREESGAFIVSRESTRVASGRILLLHGYGQSRFEALPLATRLALGDWEVCVPDLPGHGDSPEELSSLTVHAAMNDWLRDFKPRILIGHSLGARLALAMGGSARVVAISPPIENRFDEATRAELLAHLRPRWVREGKPMAALSELLEHLPLGVAEAQTGLVLLAQKDLSSVEAGLELWRDRGESWSLERIRHSDHGSILVSASTAERILAWIRP